ncbi:hypothetical protein [Azospirillum sp. ST 5-10]|uniref:hypothetical protein n=1 Tax=unclassified Azospirillum TaxID=2630922 RepID=UPI003F4A56B7
MATALTVSVLAVLATASRRVALAAAAGDARWVGVVESGLALVAGGVLLAVGSLLLTASLTAPPAPFP